MAKLVRAHTPLEALVTTFIEHGAGLDDLYSVLRACVAEPDTGLEQVVRLFTSDYGGFTYKHELKGVSATVLLAWGEQGLEALIDGARRTGRVNDVGFAVRLLSAVAADAPFPMLGEVNDAQLAERIAEVRVQSPHLAASARQRLIALVLSYEDEDDLVFHVAGNLGRMSGATPETAVELFRALATRWLAINTNVIDAYDALITAHPNDEPRFQRFLTDHPQLLDPMAMRVWPLADLLGEKRPDFMIQRMDDSYLVIEIECPGKLLMTKTLNLSAKAAHAERQATDYRTWLVQHHPQAVEHFPNFQEPDCLAVCGLESTLSARERRAFEELHHNRHRSRIAGFDWLSTRARSVATNIIRGGVEQRRAKMR